MEWLPASITVYVKNFKRYKINTSLYLFIIFAYRAIYFTHDPQWYSITLSTDQT